jgi:hypothetical protein
MTFVALILASILLLVLALLYHGSEVGGSFLLALARVELPQKKSKIPNILLGLSIALMLFTFVYFIHLHVRIV